MGWLSRNRSWIRHEGWLSRGLGMVEISPRELGTANAPFHIKDQMGRHPFGAALFIATSMFSFTFLIFNGVGHIIAKLPR